MALMNTAAILAAEGKRVLVVDFDLEAPGLDTYEPFRQMDTSRGIVDFVSEYLDTNSSPDVEQYIIEGRIDEDPIWFLPAGIHTDHSYSENLHSIDWRHLYEERSGFLLIEDLKQQWALFDDKGFDYVLVDSRTGHTDVGGICTRQLPDAVVVMFVPTYQNIDGLVPIVESIRKERHPVRRSAVELHFCPANVPDIDDEEGILRGLLSYAEKELGYDEPAALINHYPHLEILEQKVFCRRHSKSRLGKQYRRLTSEVRAGNLDDREGALYALRMLPDRYEKARRRNNFGEVERRIDSKISQISENFSEDGEIAFGLAKLANRMVRREDEITHLGVAIEQGYEKNLATIRRAYAATSLNEDDLALSDARSLISSAEATLFEASPALEIIRAITSDEDYLAIVKELAEKQITNDPVGGLLLQRLMVSRAGAEDVLKLARMRNDLSRGQRVHTSYVLALIATRNFEEALSEIGSKDEVSESSSIVSVFNYAMAEWGQNGEVDLTLINLVLSLAETEAFVDPNARQCFALCHGLLGNREQAFEELRRAKRAFRTKASSFSCWVYLERELQDFSADLDEMRSAIAGEGVLHPPFLT
ncbi:hypothetical protein HUO12_02965 [Altererythrobacter sp. JGD-16]|uniref:Uncharacterized protein n=2 Tax=Altererythrobacter lutimaris TaxID=2743979 RepID=A0A850HGI7_9SPHN|nr:hypothetical protein [Altererythrobacter lutimaris]